MMSLLTTIAIVSSSDSVFGPMVLTETSQKRIEQPPAAKSIVATIQFISV